MEMRNLLNTGERRILNRPAATNREMTAKYTCLFLLVSISIFPSAEAICYTVTVTGASSYSYPAPSYGINDYYYLLSTICQNNNIWGDDYNYQYGQYNNYLSYRTNFQLPGTNTTIPAAWTIRGYGCDSDTSASIYAYSPGYYSYPYTVPYGSWYQLDPYSKIYLRNYNLSVDCYYPALSAWAIVGIVIGSLCAAAVLCALIACICSHTKKRKQRTQAPASRPPPPPEAIYVTSNDYATITTVGGSAVGYPQPAFSTPINPPAYDNAPPPAYSYTK